jgi:uncharacterized membrane protein
MTAPSSRFDLVGTRTAVAGATGLVVGTILAFQVAWEAAVLAGWVVAATVNLVWTWRRIVGLDAREAKEHAGAEDPSRRLSEGLVIVAGVALLAAVGLLLARAGASQGGTKAYLICVGVLSVIASWATIHTVFTLRYARAYYRGGDGGIDFNEPSPPTYLDFAYLSFTIGMTFQVSDTNLTDKGIRHTALGHALLSFLFGAVIIALSINVVASLLG